MAKRQAHIRCGGKSVAITLAKHGHEVEVRGTRGTIGRVFPFKIGTIKWAGRRLGEPADEYPRYRAATATGAVKALVCGRIR